MEKLDQYVKIAEAAKILGVAENTLRTWADEGKISATRNPANGYRLFRKQDLAAFLEKAAKPVEQATHHRRPR